ncbi:MAG: leucine-rich repeat protein [Firmicutes bacterium]|nr:leucine-rich repeat protein [Bacillota bacterium]
MKDSLLKLFKKTSKARRIAIISAVLVIVGAIASVSYITTKAASSDDGILYLTSDGLWYYLWDRENDYQITIVGYNGTDTDVVFPSKTYTHQFNGTIYNDVKVKFTAIATSSYGESFWRNISAADVTSVTIPDNITEIGYNVFNSCTSLTSVSLPSTLTSIGNNAFYNCTSLTSINLPSSLTSIGNSAFAGCKSIEKIVLPDSLTKLDGYAFQNCTSLSDVNFPPKLTYIPNSAFENTALQNVVIPYGYASIGSCAFRNCYKLANIVIPQSVKRMDSDVFWNCTALEKVVIPNSVTELSSWTFENCTSLKSVTLPKGIKVIPYDTFYGCTSLTEVKNIDQITEIQWSAFQGCTSLTTLELPDTLTRICSSAFADSGVDPCALNLKNVTTIDSNAFQGTTCSGEFTIPPKVTYLRSNTFYNATVPKLIIPSTVTSIESNALRYSRVKELVWETASSIPYRFMQDNAYIEKVTITKNISYIDDYAFYNCSNLKEVNAKDINTIYYYGFRNCKSLQTFTANDIRYIDDYAFYDDSALVSVNAKCTYYIDQYAFYNCSKLTNISDLINNVQTINTRVFQNCSSLGEVKLGGKLSNIGQYAFYNSGITYLDASSFIQISTGYIGSEAFGSCKNIKEVYWNSVAETSLFKGCTALTTFTFGPRCYNLRTGSYMFQGCSALTDIYYLNKSTPSSINNYLMYGTPNIETIHYYKPTSGTDSWQSYYNSYGSTYSFVLEDLGTAPAIVSNVTIKQSDGSTVSNGTNFTIGIGESMQFSAVITYSNGTTAVATPDNAVWYTTSDVNYVTVDQTGKVTGKKTTGSNYFNVYIKSKEENYSSYIRFKVVDNSVPESSPATKIELYELQIDSTSIDYKGSNKQFIGKPFAMDKGNNGINNNAYSHIRFYVYPAYSSDTPTVEIIEGSDIVTAAEPSLEFNSSSGYTCFVSGLTHIPYEDEEGNITYKYGDITIKVTAGDAEPLIYSFVLEKESKIPNGAAFDNSQYQSEYKLTVGESYKYTAFPTEWDASENPYMWYEVTYSIDDESVADLEVATEENAVYDVNNDKYYTARVATLTPKKPGTVKLRAHSGRYANNYTEITLTVLDDEENPIETERPAQSDDPDEVWATSVTFPQTTVTMLLNSTQNLIPSVTPANTTDELTYYSLDKTVASINADTGLITANKVGETTVGVSTSSGLNATVKVIVVSDEVKTTSMTVPASVSMFEGDTVTLTITRTPANTTDDLVITSDNEDVVKIVDGRLTAVAAGTATVTVTSGDISKTCAVTVNKAVTGITLDKTTAELKRGDTLQLTATLQPEGATGDVQWTSSNTQIATVSSTGKVTAVGYGDVEITATVNSKYSAVCKIFVAPNIDFTILGASIRISDPYGIRFGIQLGKTGDYGKVEIVEYGTVMMPTEKLGSDELLLSTDNVLKVKGEVIYSETSSALVYTGVLINIPNSFFGTDVSGRGYLIYKDTNGAQHTIYTDTVSRSFNGVAQAAYDSYSQIANPTDAQQAIIDKLRGILGI